MVHKALVIYSIPASLLFITWFVLFGVFSAFDTLLPITAIGTLIWTYIEFAKVEEHKRKTREKAQREGAVARKKE
jgi:positive regulator of sigma E activity